MSDDISLVHRRELLRRAAVLLGTSLSAPAVLGVMNGCSAHAAPASRQPALLSTDQLELVGEIADIMIPSTDTPGARDVGVPAFIDTMLADVYPVEDRKRYLAGLAAFEVAVQRHDGAPFLALPPAQRRQWVQNVHDAELEAAGGGPEVRHRRPFMLMTKELTLLGFFTSEAGATLVLQHDPLPGAYHGCLRLAETGDGRTWAQEKSLPF